MSWVISSFLFLWIAFNVAAPFAILYRAERISPGRLPRELFVWADARRVRFYLADIPFSLGYSVWAPPRHIVIFNRQFFQRATPGQVRFVVAHELAHFRLGHHWKRWFSVVTLAILLPQTRQWLERMEDEADAEAERLTGISRKYVFAGLFQAPKEEAQQ